MLYCYSVSEKIWTLQTKWAGVLGTAVPSPSPSLRKRYGLLKRSGLGFWGGPGTRWCPPQAPPFPIITPQGVCMNDNDRRRPAGEAYTGETIVMPEHRRPARRLSWRMARRALLIVLALALVALGLFYLQIRSVAGRIVVRDVRPNAPVASPLVGGMNLLIVGVDERAGHPEEGVRSDTLIVVHLDALGRWASLLSIPRDSRVSLRDVGETKVNVAYGQGYANAEGYYGPGTTPQQGGMALTAQTVEQLLELPQRGQHIDAVAQINFDGFAKVIDALGGITIDVPRPIVDDAYPTPDFGTTRIEFAPGVQRMDGATALIYARTRHADSDFGRAERQQQVLRAIANELRQRGLLGQLRLAPRLLGGLEGAVTTTMPIARPDVLLGLAWLGSGLNPDELGQLRLSPETAPNYREEGSDLIWDPNDVRAVVDTFLTQPSEANEAATVQVLNGTEVGGLAGSKSGEIERQGFTMIAAGNAPSADIAKTIVYDLTGKPRTSRRLAKLLGAELRQGAPEGVTTSADIVVLLGKDQAK
jgi:LCP family protein required for cell wall assembly